MRRFLFVLLGGLLLSGGGMLTLAPVTAGDGKVAANATTPIRVPSCQISVIDEVELASDRAGVIAFVEPKEGDRVSANQQIAGLKDYVARAQYNVAKKRTENDVEIRYAVKAHEVAVAEYQKSLDANRLVRNAVPESEIRRLKLSADKSELQIEQAQHQFELHGLELKQAEAELKTYQIIAPFDGVVTRVDKKTGEAVRQGDPILTLINTERLRVEGQVDIKDVWRIQPGDSVKVQIVLPEIDVPVEREVFEGRIAFVDETVEPVLGTVTVWAEVVNRDGLLKAGLPAKMSIVPSQPSQANTALKSK